MIHITTLKPDYYDKFHCACGDCKYNCCSYPWRITVDKQTYKSYQKMKCSPELAANLKKYVVKEDFPTDAAYAVLHHEVADGKACCPFQDENGLCSIQVEFGYQALSLTCQIYPRSVISFIPKDTPDSTILEYAMINGCEVVAKLLYDNHEPLQFIAEEFDMTQNKFNNLQGWYTCTINEKQRKIFTHLFQIQATEIAILQNRELSFEDRLILLGMFLDKIQKLEDEGREDDIPAEIAKFVNGVDEAALADSFANIQPNLKLQIHTFALCHSTGITTVDKVFDSVDSVFVANHDKAGETDIEQIERYKHLREKHSAWFKDNAYFFENLLVNFLVLKVLPFTGNNSITDQYCSFALTYSFLRYFITYYMDENDDITERELIDITSLFGRTFMNASTGINLNAVLKQVEADDISRMAMLIK